MTAARDVRALRWLSLGGTSSHLSAALVPVRVRVREDTVGGSRGSRQRSQELDSRAFKCERDRVKHGWDSIPPRLFALWALFMAAKAAVRQRSHTTWRRCFRTAGAAASSKKL